MGQVSFGLIPTQICSQTHKYTNNVFDLSKSQSTCYRSYTRIFDINNIVIITENVIIIVIGIPLILIFIRCLWCSFYVIQWSPYSLVMTILKDARLKVAVAASCNCEWSQDITYSLHQWRQYGEPVMWLIYIIIIDTPHSLTS